MFQALQTKACKAISVMFSEESGEASMSISSELSRKRSGTHMDMAVLMPVKRLRLSQSLVHASPPGMTSSLPLTSPQPSCTGKLCYVKKHERMHDNVFWSMILSYCCCFLIFFYY